MHGLDLPSLLFNPTDIVVLEQVITAWINDECTMLVDLVEVAIEEISQVKHSLVERGTLLGGQIRHLFKGSVHLDLKLTWRLEELVLHTVADLLKGTCKDGQLFYIFVLE